MIKYRMEQNWSNEIRKELVYFYLLCSKKDKDFLDNTRKRTDEDFVRLMYIAYMFGFRRMAISIACKAGDNFEKSLTEMSDNARVMQWMQDFMDNMPDTFLKETVLETWDEIQADMKKYNRTVHEEIKLILLLQNIADALDDSYDL